MYSNVSSCFLFPARQSCFLGVRVELKTNKQKQTKNKITHTLSSIGNLCLETSLQVWCQLIRLCFHLGCCLITEISKVQVGFSFFNHNMMCNNALVLYLVQDLKNQYCPAPFNCSILGIVWSLKSDGLRMKHFLTQRHCLISVRPLRTVKY